MKTTIMDEIMRQRDPELKAAVEAYLAGEIGKAFENLGSNVAERHPVVVGQSETGFQSIARVLGTVQRGRNHVGARGPRPAVGGLEGEADTVQ